MIKKAPKLKYIIKRKAKSQINVRPTSEAMVRRRLHGLFCVFRLSTQFALERNVSFFRLSSDRTANVDVYKKPGRGGKE